MYIDNFKKYEGVGSTDYTRYGPHIDWAEFLFTNFVDTEYKHAILRIWALTYCT
jgi:hypothetical protein